MLWLISLSVLLGCLMFVVSLPATVANPFFPQDGEGMNPTPSGIPAKTLTNLNPHV